MISPVTTSAVSTWAVQPALHGRRQADGLERQPTVFFAVPPARFGTRHSLSDTLISTSSTTASSINCRTPLQQIWLDHLLALQLRANQADGWDTGTFVLLHPVGNIACAAAAASYRRSLTGGDTFDVQTLDEVVQAARLAAIACVPALPGSSARGRRAR